MPVVDVQILLGERYPEMWDKNIIFIAVCAAPSSAYNWLCKWCRDRRGERLQPMRDDDVAWVLDLTLHPPSGIICGD